MVKYYIHAADGVLKKNEKKEVDPCALTRKAHKGRGHHAEQHVEYDSVT